MNALTRGMIENFTDEYIERISGVDKGIVKVQELLDENLLAHGSTNTKDLLLGYHIGRMLQFTISRMGSRGDDNKFWTPEDIWSAIQNKLNRLTAKIDTELGR